MVRDGGDCRGRPGTARVMSHEVKRIRSEVYGLNLAVQEVQALGL